MSAASRSGCGGASDHFGVGVRPRGFFQALKVANGWRTIAPSVRSISAQSVTATMQSRSWKTMVSPCTRDTSNIWPPDPGAANSGCQAARRGRRAKTYQARTSARSEPACAKSAHGVRIACHSLPIVDRVPPLRIPSAAIEPLMLSGKLPTCAARNS